MISKLKTGAWLGMVVPNKWMTIEAGHKLRAMLASNGLVAEVVDFGNELHTWNHIVPMFFGRNDLHK